MYTLEPLSYSYDALEPLIGTRTVTIHYTKHEQGYLDRLNRLLEKLHFDFSYPLVDIIHHIEDFPLENRADILYNAGGVLNHELYWNSISPNKQNKPVGKIKKAIEDTFGSYEKFVDEFKNNAKKVVGSGWTFLVLTPDNRIQIINTSNQETPYLYGFIPVLALDMWEHAYYLDYQNNKDQYIDSFFSMIDFEKINQIYEQNL